MILKNISTFPIYSVVYCYWVKRYDRQRYFSLRTQTYFRLSLFSAENNVCETESGKDFSDVMTFVSLWPIRFHDRMKLEGSLQRIPCAVVLGLFELNCDWLKVPTSQKSCPGSGSQTLFSTETSDSRKYVCVRRLALLQIVHLYGTKQMDLEIITVIEAGILMGDQQVPKATMFAWESRSKQCS